MPLNFTTQFRIILLCKSQFFAPFGLCLKIKASKNVSTKAALKMLVKFCYLNKASEVYRHYVTHYVNEDWNSERMLNYKFETKNPIKKQIWLCLIHFNFTQVMKIFRKSVPFHFFPLSRKPIVVEIRKLLFFSIFNKYIRLLGFT